MGRKEEEGEGVGEEGGKNDNFLTQNLLNIGIPSLYSILLSRYFNELFMFIIKKMRHHNLGDL